MKNRKKTRKNTNKENLKSKATRKSKNNNSNIEIFQDIIKESINEWDKIEGDILESIRCPKCKGIIYEDIDIEDLFWEEEKEVKEFACLICGYRFYIDISDLKAKININKNKYN
jgi:Zn ribbon nucleic-acid-binding protein